MEHKYFVDAKVTDQPFPAVCFRSGMTTYHEALIGGQYVGRSWNAAGHTQPDNCMLDPTSHPTPWAFWIEVDGQLLHSHWQWIEATQEESQGNLHVIISLKHTVRPVEIKVHTLLDGTAVITRWIDITNTSDKPAALSASYPWSGVLYTAARSGQHYGEDDPGAFYSIGYTADARWGGEGNFEFHPLPNAGFRIDGTYRRLRHRQPMFILKNEVSGEHFIGQLAWSGGWSFEFDYDARPGISQRDPRLFFRGGPDAPAPLRMIDPGETVTTPKMHLGIVAGDLDATIQAMHEHLRKSVFLPQPRGRGGWVEAGLGPEHEITEELTHQCIDAAAEVGAEVFFIDAGWFAGPGGNWDTTVGDWNVGSRFPNGLKPIRDYVRSKGMLWGLWMEPERIGEESQTFKDHPDWITDRYDGGKIGGWIDMAKPEVAKWVEDQIYKVITENELDFFRLDHNVGGPRAGGWNEHNGYLENAYWRYYEAFYGMFERIRERFPNVILENCASGGGRTDIGTVRYFSHSWVTDWQTAPRSFSITNGLTMALPPERVDRHLLGIGQNPHIAGEIDFQYRLSLFTRPTICPFLHPVGWSQNPLMVERIKHCFDLYKNFVRPFQPTSRIYHHTPTATQRNPHGFGVLEMVAEDKSRAIAGIFNLGRTDETEYLLRFRGLDVGKHYRVTSESTNSTWEADGKDLVYGGVTVRVAQPLTSELLVLSSKF
jgi:alpha-galactosidase